MDLQAKVDCVSEDMILIEQRLNANSSFRDGINFSINQLDESLKVLRARCVRIEDSIKDDSETLVSLRAKKELLSALIEEGQQESEAHGHVREDFLKRMGG